jgi:hypothetical protein
MVSSLVLSTSIASRTQEGTLYMRWTMTQQRLVGYAIDHFFGPLYDIEEECKLLGLILMESLKKGKLNHCQFYKSSGNGWKRHYRKRFPKHPYRQSAMR